MYNTESSSSSKIGYASDIGANYNSSKNTNASSRKKDIGDIGMIKGSLLALLLCGKGLIGRVVDVPGSSVSLGVYR